MSKEARNAAALLSGDSLPHFARVIDFLLIPMFNFQLFIFTRSVAKMS